MDAAARALADVEAVFPELRARARAVAEATTWECETMRRFRRRLQDWDDDVARLAARVADDREQLRAAVATGASSAR
jgi:hypothetical protein